MATTRLKGTMLLPAGLLLAIVLAAGVTVYHALDSWYLQSANATRLRADYSEIAATRFVEQAEAAQGDYEATFAEIFARARLLPAGVPAPGGNSAAFAIDVTNAEGSVVYRSGNPRAEPYLAQDTVLSSGMIVSVAAKKSAVAWLATEHLASRTMLILWLTVLSAVAAIVTMRLMRREARLAQARTGFVASVSHELRTPLAQIQILLETLRLGRFKTEDQREWTLDGMQREVTRLTTLVNNVLRFAASERDPAHSLSRRPVALSSFLTGVVDSFRPLASARGVEIQVDAQSENLVSIDPDALTQVILNILDNAIKYGGGRRIIRVKANTDSAVARIRISDQGSGVPEGDRSRIWEPFTRGSNAETSGAGGSGIGLSVVRDIVRAHGGTVYLDESVSTGASFVIELPLER